jgi:lysozyme family protein
LCDARLAFLKRLKTWPTFGVGWGRRVVDVKATSLKMAKGTAAPLPPPPDVPRAKVGWLQSIIAAVSRMFRK